MVTHLPCPPRLYRPEHVEDIFCLEYHNYLGGRPEINLVNPEGLGVSIPAEYLPLLIKSLEHLQLVMPVTAKGECSYLLVDSEGRVELERRKQG